MQATGHFSLWLSNLNSVSSVLHDEHSERDEKVSGKIDELITL